VTVEVGGREEGEREKVEEEEGRAKAPPPREARFWSWVEMAVMGSEEEAGRSPLSWKGEE
jgi:hypothetical protein